MCRIMFVILILLTPQIGFTEWKSLEDYYSALQSGCKADIDCEVKNVGNCCGGMPRCVLANSNPDPKWVSKFCSEKGLVGVCGYPMITGCRCETGVCKDLTRSVGDVETPIMIQ